MMTEISARSLSWFGIIRLGLVQMALGGIIALATSTLNRVMVVELALPASLPGVLFGLHYAAEMLRPRWGHGSDKGALRTPWIIGGMAILALSGAGAAISIAVMSVSPWAGVACAVMCYIGIGVGAGAAGTTLLVLIAELTAPSRKPAAAALVWTLMIAGTAIAALSAGALLKPFSMLRLVSVSAGVSVIAFMIAMVSLWDLERSFKLAAAPSPQTEKPKGSFIAAMRDVWTEPAARRLTVFIFISMLAFSAQELLLEPFAGSVFAMSPSETAQLFGSHRGGIVLGMVLGAIIGSLGAKRHGLGRLFVAGGCLFSAFGLFALTKIGIAADASFLKSVVFALGVANGFYAVAAIGTMISLSTAGKGGRDGVRMGLWGAAQAIAFGLGGVLGTVAVDIARASLGAAAGAYGLVFFIQGVLFLAATVLAIRLTSSHASDDKIVNASSADASPPVLSQIGAR